MVFRRLFFAVAIMAATGESTADEPTQVTRQAIDSLDRLARKQFEASKAFNLYQQFEHTNAIPDELRAKFDSKFGEWKARADKGLVRLGVRWVTTEEHAEIAAEARKMVDEAVTLLTKFDEVAGLIHPLHMQQHREATKNLLEKASRHDKNSVLADFLLGILNSGASGKWSRYSVSYPKAAAKQFKIVLKRAPIHVGAMNNLAVAYLKEGEYRRAVALWEKAIAIEPENSAIKHNVRRTLFEDTEGTIKLKQTTLAKLRALVKDEVEALPLAGIGRAWVISPVVLPDTEREQDKKTEEQQPAPIAPVAAHVTGTGFVVADGYVLTNRHVVKHELYGTAATVHISMPGTEENGTLARVLRVSDEHDLALLECPDFAAPALVLSETLPRLGSEFMAIGFPPGDIFGKSVKVTRGTVSALPEPGHERLLHTALLNEGNSGVPLLGPDGQVVAINTFYSTVGQPISGGVSSVTAIDFIADILPGFTGEPAGGKLEWPDVAETGTKSTVLVSVDFTNAPPIEPEWETEVNVDLSCAHCKGWGKVACPNPKCYGGEKLAFHYWRDTKLVEKDGNTFATRPIMKRIYVGPVRRKSFKIQCRTCGGDHAVDCRFCKGTGFNPQSAIAE